MPVTRTGVATSLLRSLLGGPTPWLAPAVITAFPANTQLTVDSAPIADGVVQVDLSTAVLSASPDDRKALSAQLVWTLRQLPEVTGVRITVQSVPLQVPGAGVVQSRTAWSSYDPDGLPVGAPGYLVRGDRLLELQRTDVGPVSGPFGDGRTPVLSPAVSPEGDQIAGLFPDRKTLLVGAANDKSLPVPRLTGENLSPPSWDAFGNVWAVDRRGSGSVVWAVHVGGKAVQVSANDLSTLQVSSLRLSRDGARAAVIVNNGGQGRLSLARVERRTDGSITLGALRPVESSLVEVKDVAWNDADHLAVLGRDAQGVLQPYLVDPGGTAVRVAGTLPGLATIAAAPGRPLMVGTDDGKVYQDSDSGWREVGPGRDPIYPG